MVRAHFYLVLREDGISPEQASRLATEALRRAKLDWNRDLPDVTKADLKTLKVRR